MIQLNYIIVCDRVEVAEATGNLNFFGVFDTIAAANFPAIHPILSVVTNKEIELGNHTERCVIKDEESDKVIYDSGQGNFVATKLRHQFVHNLRGLIIPVAGKYIVEIYLDDSVTPIGSTYFLVKNVGS